MSSAQLAEKLDNIEDTIFQDPFAEEVWSTTYKDHNDETVDDTFYRVAENIASAEETPELRKLWLNRFYDMLSEFKCTVGGRIYSNAGTEWGNKGKTTFFNCFVSPRGNYDIDSIEEIMRDVTNQTFTLKSEGGWGQNFSWLRPRGAFIHGIGVETPGAVKYMEIYDKTSDIITAGSGKKSANIKAKGKIRKGAMMGVLNDFHPDIIEFITAKQQPGRLTKFNISVNFSNEFMDKIIRVIELKKQLMLLEDAVGITARQEEHIQDQSTKVKAEIEVTDQWNLRFPDTQYERYKGEWDGDIAAWEAKGYPVDIYKTISATWLWNLVMESTYNRAEPGILFLDRANYYNPLNYREKIQSTNPSLAANTKVFTKEGIYPIQELEGKRFEVKSLDGQWALGECRLSGEDEEIFEIKLKGGAKSLFCTKEHKWPVYDTRMKRLYKEITLNLKPGDLIPTNKNELLDLHGDDSLTRDEGFLIGYLVGDGWFGKRSDNSGYYGGFIFGKTPAEREMADRVVSILNSLKAYPSKISERETCLELQFTSKEFGEKLISRYKLIPNEKGIPDVLWKSNDDFIAGFIDGILSSDGFISNGGNQNLRFQLTTSRESIAYGFAKILSFYGVNTTITHSVSDKASFPNKKEYERSYKRWDVYISGGNVINFNNVFSISHRSKSERMKSISAEIIEKRKHRTSSFVEVIEVVKTGRKESVWDIKVDHPQHVFPIEWCYTSNCGEQMLAPGGICCLGSINLTQFIKKDRTGFDLTKIKKYTRYLNRFLDNVNTISSAPLPEYIESMKTKRRIGIGVLGWGSALFILKVRFGSKHANELRDELISTIAREAYMSSIDIAEEKGMFSLCEPEKHILSPFILGLDLPKEYMIKLKEIGIRNSSLLSCQPTGNCVTGDSYVKLLDGTFKTIEDLLLTVINNIEDLVEGDVVKLNKDMKIPTFEGYDSFDKIYANGVQSILKIKLETGEILKQTYQHKYLVKIDDNEAMWVEAKDLKEGMKIIKLEN